MPVLMGANSFANKDELKLALNGDITDIANWDVSKVTDMSRLFHAQHLPNFNANISNWNTSSATTMFATFYEAHAFNQPLSWDTSKVTNMNSMFCRAYKFDQPLSFDTSKVTNMGGMFWDASVFNQPLSNFVTSKVTDMHFMFQDARVFNQPLNWDTSNVADMRNIFTRTNSLSLENKRLVACAWAGNSAFESAYSSWSSGAECSPMPPPLLSPSPPPPSPSPPPPSPSPPPPSPSPPPPSLPPPSPSPPAITVPQSPPSPPLAPFADEPCTENTQDDRCKVTLKIKARLPPRPMHICPHTNAHPTGTQKSADRAAPNVAGVLSIQKLNVPDD